MSDSFKASERTQFQPRRHMQRNWPRYAKALDMWLAGATLLEIGGTFEVSKQRAQQMVRDARQQLAYRVFKDVPRPLLPPPSWTR